MVDMEPVRREHGKVGTVHRINGRMFIINLPQLIPSLLCVTLQLTAPIDHRRGQTVWPSAGNLTKTS